MGGATDSKARADQGGQGEIDRPPCQNGRQKWRLRQGGKQGEQSELERADTARSPRKQACAKGQQESRQQGCERQRKVWRAQHPQGDGGGDCIKRCQGQEAGDDKQVGPGQSAIPGGQGTGDDQRRTDSQTNAGKRLERGKRQNGQHKGRDNRPAKQEKDGGQGGDFGGLPQGLVWQHAPAQDGPGDDAKAKALADGNGGGPGAAGIRRPGTRAKIAVDHTIIMAHRPKAQGRGEDRGQPLAGGDGKNMDTCFRQGQA